MQQIGNLMMIAAAIAVAGIEAKPVEQTPPQTVAAAPKEGPKILFALIYRPGPKWRPGRPFREQIAIKEHYAYVKGLFARGVVFSGGGMGTERGLVLLYARDQAEADSILLGDPMVQAGSFTGEVLPHTPAFLSDKPLTRTRE